MGPTRVNRKLSFESGEEQIKGYGKVTQNTEIFSTKYGNNILEVGSPGYKVFLLNHVCVYGGRKFFCDILGMPDPHETKGMWVDWMLDPCCDFQLWPHPWPWPLIFKVKFWKSRNSGIGCPIDMERKGCELTECWTHVVTLNFDLTHDLDLEFSMSNFEIAVSQEWEGRLTWNEKDMNR